MIWPGNHSTKLPWCYPGVMSMNAASDLQRGLEIHNIGPYHWIFLCETRHCVTVLTDLITRGAVFQSSIPAIGEYDGDRRRDAERKDEDYRMIAIPKNDPQRQIDNQSGEEKQQSRGESVLLKSNSTDAKSERPSQHAFYIRKKNLLWLWQKNKQNKTTKYTQIDTFYKVFPW